MTAIDIAAHPLHLGLGATASMEPAYSGEMAWYADYAQRHTADGAEGRLVAMHTFTTSWEMWEMHPKGCEVVLCTAGTITLVQEMPDGAPRRIALGPGQYAINQPGTWHTADVETEATVLFITAGLDTQHRPR